MSLTGCSFLIAALLALSVSARDFTVRDGNREHRFVEVDGASELPIEYMRTGTDLGHYESVTLPKYWIADKPVTEGEFAERMHRSVRPGRKPDDPVVDIEWAEAEEYCRRYTRDFSSRLPDNTIASMPSMVEWAHAVRILKDRIDLCVPVGTFLFTGSRSGGFLYTLWKDALPEDRGRDVNETLAVRHAVSLKRCRHDHVGLRLVLVDISEEMLGAQPIVARGIVSLQHGFYEAAEYYVRLALSRGELSVEARAHAEDALACVKASHDEEMEDWSGLVALSAAFARKRGFVTAPYENGWQMRGCRPMEDPKTALAYRKAGVDGGWLSIRDLPREIRANQAADASNLVQVVACDFTGDGRKDLIVERFGAVGSFGYWYDFYERQTNGVYVAVHALQTVGLCILPHEDGRSFGFLSVDKCSDSVLTVSLLTYENGSMGGVPAHDRPFCMLDAEKDRLYVAAPFVGGGRGSGWSILEERGVWYRPLYWPWKPGRTGSATCARF